MVRGIFSICTGMQGGSLITLLFPEGGQWEKEEVLNREVMHTESQVCAFHFDISLSLERKMPGYCTCAGNYLRNLVFQIGPTCTVNCMALRTEKMVTSFIMKKNIHFVF